MEDFSFDQFSAFLRDRGMERLAFLLEKYGDSDERRELDSMLPAIGKRLREKGLLPEVAAGPEFTPAEERALVYLRELDAALSAGGHDAALAKWTELVKDPTARAALLEVSL